MTYTSIFYNRVKKTACFMAVLSATAGYAAHTRADNIDYGALQSVFGEPVTTSVTGTPQRASDVPANMTIITAEDIRRAGTRNIPQIIGIYVPGIDIFQYGLATFDIGIRGYQQTFQPRLQVLVDGRQVFLDDYSRTIWNNIPVNIDDIRQIEVVKGANSALFGSNASGGVVNIITYSPIYDSNRVATAGYGSQSERFADATVTQRFGNNNGIKFSGGGMNASEFRTDKNPTDTVIFNPRRRYVTESSVFQANHNLQVSTEASYSESKANEENPDVNTGDASVVSSYSVRGGFVWQSGIGLITNDNYINHSSVTAIATTLGAALSYPQSVDLFVSQLGDQFKIGANQTFRLTLEYRHKYFNEADAPEAIPQAPRFDSNVYAASGSWLWQITDALAWTNALRFEHQDEQQTGQLFGGSFYTNADYSHIINDLSANSGLVYKATDLDTIRAIYGRGVQLPSFIEGGDNIILPIGLGAFYDIEGNPHLKPTIVQNYELDYDRQLPDINSTVRLATFYQINQDIISFLTNISPTPRFYNGAAFILTQSANSGKSQGFGGEIELKGSNSKGFKWDASYSYARDIDSGGVASTLGYDGSAPAHHFRLAGGYTTGPWEFDANSQVVSSSYMLHSNDSGLTRVPGSTGGYFSLGSRIGYAINDRFTVALYGTNLTRANTQESPFPAVERQVFLSVTGKF